MTQNLAHTLAFGCMGHGVSFLSPGHFSALTGLPRVSPDDDHCVGLMVGASAGPLWREGCGSNDVCDVVPNGSAHRFGARAKGRRFSRVLDEEFSSLEADGSRGVWVRYLLGMKGRQIRYESGQWSLRLMQILLVRWLIVSMTFSEVSWCPLWFRISQLAEVSAETWHSRNVSHSKMLASVLRRACMGPMPHILLTTAPLSQKRTSGIEDACS